MNNEILDEINNIIDDNVKKIISLFMEIMKDDEGKLDDETQDYMNGEINLLIDEYLNNIKENISEKIKPLLGDDIDNFVKPFGINSIINSKEFFIESEFDKIINHSPVNTYFGKWISKVATEKEIENVKYTANYNNIEKPDFMDEDIDHPVAFIDGSFNPKNKTVGFGGIVFFSDDKVVEYYGGIKGIKELEQMRNVSGELCAMIILMDLARSYESIEIYYDYYGIEKWADGTWKRNKVATKKYHKIMKNIMKELNIVFSKLASHSGNSGNERADELAKKGSGVNESDFDDQDESIF